MKRAMLVIDVQEGIMRSAAHPDQLLQTISSLLERARAAGTPVIYIQHDEPEGMLLTPHTPAWQIHHAIAPQEGESTIRKRASDSFHETCLHDELQQRGIEHLIITGCQTDFCVDTTCRRAVTQGYGVTLVKDGHSTEDGGSLSADQIIAHHNYVLNGFGTDKHTVRVLAAQDVAI